MGDETDDLYGQTDGSDENSDLNLTDTEETPETEEAESQEQEFDASSRARDAEGEDRSQETEDRRGEPEPTAEIAATRPFVPSGNPHYDALREQLGDEIAYSLMNAVRHEQQQGFTAQAFAGNYSQQIAEAAPELVRVHGRRIPEFHAQLPAEVRGTPLGAFLSAFGPEIEEMQRTGDVGGAMKRIGRLLAPAQPQRQAQPRPELTPQQRVPSPGSGVGGGNRAQTARPARNSVAGTLSEVFGLSDEEAKRLASHGRE